MRKVPRVGLKFLLKSAREQHPTLLIIIFRAASSRGSSVVPAFLEEGSALLVRYRFCELSFNLAAPGRFDCDFQP